MFVYVGESRYKYTSINRESLRQQSLKSLQTLRSEKKYNGMNRTCLETKAFHSGQCPQHREYCILPTAREEPMCIYNIKSYHHKQAENVLLLLALSLNAK